MAEPITKKKPAEAEPAAQSTSQYARSLIEASLDPFVTISPEGKITDVNEATVKVTGVPRRELIGTDFLNYFTEPERAREGYREVFEKGFVTDYPLTIRHRDGKLTDVLYNASVYRDASGRVLGVFAAARDVTESRRLMRELAETKNFSGQHPREFYQVLHHRQRPELPRPLLERGRTAELRLHSQRDHGQGLTHPPHARGYSVGSRG